MQKVTSLLHGPVLLERYFNLSYLFTKPLVQMQIVCKMTILNLFTLKKYMKIKAFIISLDFFLQNAARLKHDCNITYFRSLARIGKYPHHLQCYHVLIMHI